MIFANPKSASTGGYGHLPWLEQASVVAACPQGGLPLFAHLQRYPGVVQLILDFTIHLPNVATNLTTGRTTSVPGDNTRARGNPGIQDLRIHLPLQTSFKSDRISATLGRLAEMSGFTNLRKLLITMLLSTENSRRDAPTDKDGESWRKIFKSIDSIAKSWKRLDVIKIWVKVNFWQRNERLPEGNLWVSSRGLYV